MSLTSGSRLGAYEILAPIGAGGMGEVYRAKDTTLDREVAIKILPDVFAHDAERVARFTREAKTLASLNHPNIAQIYGILEEAASPLGPAKAGPHVDHAGVRDSRPDYGGDARSVTDVGAGFSQTQSHLHALVMELVEGDDLSVLIARGALPLAEALPIAKQIADALEAAHDQGVVHRDLKPANIKVRSDGTVKVLDFGLAKAMDPAGATGSGDAMASPTLTARGRLRQGSGEPGTQMGMILGTAAYMAPEQAKGKSVDKRADIWAFGVVLYEMLAGRRAFPGDDVTEVMASVVLRDPDLTALPADVPLGVRRLLTRCLQKDPKRRLRDIAEGMLQLDDDSASLATAPAVRSGATPVVVAAPVKRTRWKFVLSSSAMLLVGAAVATALWIYLPRPATPSHPVRFVIAPPDPVALVTGGNHHNIAFSPDGRKIVYTGAGTNGTNVQLYVRSLDQLDATAIRGTAGGVGPFFSPDNQWVGFVDQSSRTIKKVSIFGGPAVTICEVPGFASGANWGTAGTIVFGTFSAGLFTVPEGGGQPQALTAPDAKAGEGSHTWPSFLPGANAVVFVTARGGAAMATGQLAVVALDTRKVTRFGVAGSSPRFLPTGHLVYATGDGTLRAQAFDLKTLALTGNPVPVLEGLQVKTTGAANYALSATGSLVSVSGNGLAEPRTLVWVDRAGKEALIAAPPRPYVYAWVSPDGTKASLDVRDEENDIWVWEFARQTLTRLTFDPGSDQYGIWTPNGRQVAFSGTREGASGVFLRSADGTGADQRVTDSGPAQYPNGFTPDGSRLVLRMTTSGSEDDLFTVPIAGPGEARKATPLISTARTDRNAVVAPDGRWIAYESNDSGAFQVFVQPFPDVRGGRWQISTTGGLKPAWSRDGRELFYVANDQLMVTRIDTSQGFKPGTPEALFSTKAYYLRTNGRNYDVAPDGRRFLMIKDQVVAGQAALGMTVVLNWFDEVKARTPVK